MQLKAKHKPFFLLVAILGIYSPYAQAQMVDPMIEGAKLCTRHLQRYEREYGIPAHLLSAIASTESGRYHSGLKIKLPWPWTINAEGKGYFFDTKAEAIVAAQKLRQRGVQSMDVGCMQVNLYHHADAFTSLSQAFEPESNIAYAAGFLRNLYQEEGSWKKASGDYHSKTPKLGSEYVGLVYNSWRSIVDKLRTARLSVPSSSVNGLQDMQRADNGSGNIVQPVPYSPPAPKQIILAKQDGNQQFSQKILQKVPQKQTQKSLYKSPLMKSISVRNQGDLVENKVLKTKENGITIVRPEIKIVNSSFVNNNSSDKGFPEQNSPPEPMVMADARAFNAVKSLPDKPANDLQNIAQPVSSQVAPQAKVIRLDNKMVDRTPVNLESAKKNGPNFIFND